MERIDFTDALERLKLIAINQLQDLEKSPVYISSEGIHARIQLLLYIDGQLEKTKTNN